MIVTLTPHPSTDRTVPLAGELRRGAVQRTTAPGWSDIVQEVAPEPAQAVSTAKAALPQMLGIITGTCCDCPSPVRPAAVRWAR